MVTSGPLLLAILVLWTSAVMTSAGSRDITGGHGNEALPAPIAMRRSCTSDLECGENHYCFSKGPNKRCIPCYNCAEAQRKPKLRTYDDSAVVCHRHRSDCGDCNEGYEMHAGLCIPVSTTTYKTQDVGMKPDLQQNASTSIFTKVLPLIVIILCVLTVTIWGLKKGAQFLSKRRQGQNGGILRLIGDSGESPSAPPSEYRNPPPNAPLASSIFSRDDQARWLFGRHSEPDQPNLVSFEIQKANPFQLGNQASDNYVEQEDEVEMMEIAEGAMTESGMDANVEDGRNVVEPQGAPNRSIGEIDMASGSNSNNSHGNGIPPSVATQTQRSEPESRRRIQERSRRNSQPAAGTSSAPAIAPSPPGPPAVSFFDERQSNPDPESHAILAEMQFLARFRMIGTWLNDPNGASTSSSNQGRMQTFNPTASSTPQRFVYSAPASPRRIDDTILVPLLEYQDPFQESMISLDSGTGTHIRSTPSRSTSGNDVRPVEFSDMDSMYDDDVRSPASNLEESDPDIVPEAHGHGRRVPEAPEED